MIYPKNGYKGSEKNDRKDGLISGRYILVVLTLAPQAIATSYDVPGRKILILGTAMMEKQALLKLQVILKIIKSRKEWFIWLERQYQWIKTRPKWLYGYSG